MICSKVIELHKLWSFYQTLCYILYSSLKVQKNSNEIDMAAIMINEHGGEIAPFKTYKKRYKQKTGSQDLKLQVFNKSRLRDL